MMELTKFITNFADQFDELDPQTLTGDSNFRDLTEWSSLTALSIIAMVDEEYDVQLKGDDIRNSNTIGDLFRAIESKKQ